MFSSQCLHWPWLCPEGVGPGAIWPQAVSWAQAFPLKPATLSSKYPHQPQEVILGFLVSLVFRCVHPGSAPLLISGPPACLSLSPEAVPGVQAGNSDVSD